MQRFIHQKYLYNTYSNSECQIAAAATLSAVTPEIATAAVSLARTLRAGGAIHYVAAGCSGIKAAANAR